MTAYYNENDPDAAAWLRAMISADAIPIGEVDERSIRDVKPSDLQDFTQCHFFAGIGGWPIAFRLAGWPDDCAVWTGSCPCQPFSCAGSGKGHEDERHLWPDFFRLIRARRPGIIFGEQVASSDVVGKTGCKLGATNQPVWFDGISNDLEAAHYTVGAVDLPAASVGAPHIRQRIFWVANSAGVRGAQHEHDARERKNGGENYTADRSGVSRLAHAEHPESGIRGASGEGRAGGGRTGPAIDGAAGGLDDATSARHASARSGQSQQSERRSGVLSLGCEDGGLGNSPSGGLGIDGPAPGSGGHAEQPGEACWMGEPIQSGLQRHAGNGNDGNEPGRLAAEAAGSVAAAGAWDQFNIARCTDGKSRRFECGSFPLAHGIPARTGPLVARLCELGLDSKTARRIVADAKRNRVIRLKGYGNAIVPELAALFIRAWLECQEAA